MSEKTENLLKKAAAMLPERPPNEPEEIYSKAAAGDYLSSGEYGLALEHLAYLAGVLADSGGSVPRGFWALLADAAHNMGMETEEKEFRGRA